MVKTLREIQNEILKIARKREGEHPFTHLAAFMEETAELSQELSHHMADPLYSENEKSVMEEKIGDVITSLSLLANHLNIDLEKSYELSFRKLRAQHNTEWTLKDSLAFAQGEKHYVFDSPTNWLEQLQLEFPNMRMHIDNEILMNEKFIPWLQEGRKKTLFRFEKDTLCVPSQSLLPLFDSTTEPLLQLGEIELTGFLVKPFRELNDDDAKAQGFNSKIEFVTAMQNLYNPKGMNDDSFVSIYHVKSFKPLNQTR